MPDAIETREVVVRYRDEGVVAGYNAATAAGNRAAAATHAVGSAMGSTMTLVDRAAASVGKFGQKAATELSQVQRAAVTSTSALGAFTGGVAAMGGQIARQKGGVKLALELNAAGDAAIFARAAAGRYTGGLKELQQAEEGAAKAAEHQARAQHEASSSRGGMAGFGAGAMLTGGSVGQKLGSIATMLPMAVAGGPAALAGAAVAAGGAIAVAIGQVAVGSVKLLAAEIVFGTKLLLGMGAAATAVGAAFGYAALNAAIQRDTQVRGLTAILGSKDAAQAELQVLREISKVPGINLETALKGAVQMRAVGIELGQVNRLLKEFANLNALIGGQPDALGRAMLQFAQMAGKGKVTGEEVRALANDLPPLLGAMRQAFGTTSAEDIEKMGMSFDVFIDRLLAVMEVGPRATSGMMNALVNLKMAWTEMLVAFGRPLLGDATVQLFDALAKGIALLTPYVEALANTIAARIPELTKHLEGAITPETVQNFVRRLLEMGVNVEYWAKSMLGSGADLVEGVGALLGALVGNFTDFQAALNTVAMGTLTVAASMVTGIARIMTATKTHINEIRMAAQAAEQASTPAERVVAAGLAWKANTTGQSAEEMRAYATRLESLRNGALAAQQSVYALGKVLDQGLAAARASGIDQLGHKIADASHRAADAMRRQAGTTAQLDEWYRKAVLSARGFTLAQQEQAKALDPATQALDREAESLKRVAAAYGEAMTGAYRYSAQQAADRAQSRAEGEAWANRFAPGLMDAARRAENPSDVTGAARTQTRAAAAEELQKQKDYIEDLKRRQKDARQEEKVALDALMEVATARQRWLEQRWKDAEAGIDGVTQAIERTVAAERKLAEERNKSARAAWEAVNAASREAWSAAEGARMDAIKEGWKDPRRLFIENNADKATRQDAPDLAAQVFGNLGLGDAELMVQAQLDQQAQFKDAIFGAAQTAGESLVDTLAQALGVILPREVALQLADQLNRSLEAAH